MAKIDYKKCRCCKQANIDKNQPSTYIQPSKGWYYHIDCYNNWIKRKDELKNNILANADDDEWKDELWDYLQRDVKIPNLNFQKLDSQWHHFLDASKKKMTAKGLFYAAKYFYGVMHGKVEDSQGGIGILPHVYDESCQYWANRNLNASVIYTKIDEQMAQQQERQVVVAKPRVVKKETKPMSLAEVMALEEDE